jgi:hypothetical protein
LEKGAEFNNITFPVTQEVLNKSWFSAQEERTQERSIAWEARAG